MRKINARFLHVFKTGSTNKTLWHERNMQIVSSLPRRTRNKSPIHQWSEFTCASLKAISRRGNESAQTRQTPLCEQQLLCTLVTYYMALNISVPPTLLTSHLMRIKFNLQADLNQGYTNFGRQVARTWCCPVAIIVVGPWYGTCYLSTLWHLKF